MHPEPIRFGTDGVRGPVGQWPLTPEGAFHIGRGLATTRHPTHPDGLVLIGADTRGSCPNFARFLAAGLHAGGCTARFAGVLPTAALSCLIADRAAAAGIMITASHNPAHDNGFKLLGPDGKKILDPTRFEHAFDASLAAPFSFPSDPPTPDPEPQPLAPYRARLPRPDLRGTRILLDAAHGAAYAVAPSVLEELGATVIRHGCSPNGTNINEGVGALHPPTTDHLRLVSADLAICLDGDADRLILVDPEAGLLDGDDVLFLTRHQTTAPLIGTIMCNGGLDAALDGRLVRVPVGDKYLAEALTRLGADIAAEPSGHILFSDGLPSGDGLYAALRVLSALPPSPTLPGQPATLRIGTPAWPRWAQASRKCPAGGRPPLDTLSTPALAHAAGMRTVIRYSGTEPLLRILVEGPADPDGWADRIATEFTTAAVSARDTR